MKQRLLLATSSKSSMGWDMAHLLLDVCNSCVALAMPYQNSGDDIGMNSAPPSGDALLLRQNPSWSFGISEAWRSRPAQRRSGFHTRHGRERIVWIEIPTYVLRKHRSIRQQFEFAVSPGSSRPLWSESGWLLPYRAALSAVSPLEKAPPPWSECMKRCNETILKVLEFADRMAEVADEGDLVREDPGCGVLFGVLRDSSFKIRKLAEEDRECHMRKGWWKSD